MSNDEAVLSRMSEVLSIELKKHSHEYRQELLHRLAFIGLRTLQNEVHHTPLHIDDILAASNRLVDTTGGSGELRKELLSIKEQLSKLTNRFEILSSEKKAEHPADVTLLSSTTTTSKKALPKSALPFPPSNKINLHSSVTQPGISTSQVSKDTRQTQEINDDQNSQSSNRQSYTSKPSSAWRSGDRSTSLSSQHGHKNQDGEAKRSNSEESPFMVSRASDSQESTKQLRCLKSPLQGGSNEIAAKVTQTNPLEYKSDTSLPSSAPIRHHLDDRGIKDVLRPVKNPWEWPNNQSDTPAASSYGSQASSSGMHLDNNSNHNNNSNMLHSAQSQYLVQQLANHIHQFQSLPIEQETLGVQDYVSLGNPQQFTQMATNTGSSNGNSNTVSTLGNGNYASPKFRENALFNNTDKKNTQQPATATAAAATTPAPVGLPPTKKGQQSVRRLSHNNKNNNETSSVSSKVATTRSQQKREELSLRRKTNGSNSSSKKKLDTQPAQPTYLKNVTSRIRQEIQNDKELSKRQSANHEVMFFVKDPHVKHSTHTFSGSQIEQQQYILESQTQQQQLLIQQQQFQQQQQQFQTQQNEEQQQQKQPSLQQQYRQQSQFELRSYPQSRQYIDSQQNPGFQYDYQHGDDNEYSSQLQPHSNYATNPGSNTNANYRHYSQPSQQDIMQNRDINEDDSYQMHLNNINDHTNNEADHLDIPAVPDLEDDSYADFSAPDQRYVWNPPSTEHLSKHENQLTHETDTMMGRDHFRSESQLQPSQQQRIPSYAHLDSRSRFDVLHSDENFNHLNYPDQSYNNNSFYSSSQKKGDSDHAQVNITSNSQNIMSIANNFLQSPLMNQLRGKESTIIADNSSHSQKRMFQQQQSQEINGRIIPKHINNSSSSKAGGISDQFNESYLNASSIHHSRSYKQQQDQGSILHDNYEKQNSSLSSSFAPFEPDQDMKVFLQKEGLFNRIFEAEDNNTSEKKFDNTFISNSNNHQNYNDGVHQITSAKSFRRQIPDFSTNAYSNNSGSHNDREDMSLNMGDSSSNSSTNQQAHPRFSPIVSTSHQQRNGEYINTSTSGRKEMLEFEGNTNKNINGINSALMEGRLSNFFANKK